MASGWVNSGLSTGFCFITQPCLHRTYSIASSYFLKYVLPVRKKYPPSPLAALRAMAPSKRPISQQAFGELAGVRQGTVAAIENQVSPLPPAAAARIEAVLWVHAGELLEGNLCTLDGSPYTPDDWRKSQECVLTADDIAAMAADICSRSNLLLRTMGPSKAAYAAHRLRQSMELILAEVEVDHEAIDATARVGSKAKIERMTVEKARKHPVLGLVLARHLASFKPKEALHVTTSTYEGWPPLREGRSVLITGVNLQTLVRAVLPDGIEVVERITQTEATIKAGAKTAKVRKTAKAPTA